LSHLLRLRPSLASTYLQSKSYVRKPKFHLLRLAADQLYYNMLNVYDKAYSSLWLIGTVRAEPETIISRAWVQSPAE